MEQSKNSGHLVDIEITPTPRYWGVRIIETPGCDRWLVDNTGRLIVYPDEIIARSHANQLGDSSSEEKGVFPRIKTIQHRARPFGCEFRSLNNDMAASPNLYTDRRLVDNF